MIINQANLFLIFTINGILIGLLFDIFRILRKSFKTSDIITYCEDLLFWILTGLLLLYSIFTFNAGEIRFYMFLAVFCGCIIYMLLFSKYFIEINVKIILTIKKIITTIFSVIILPIKTILKLVPNTYSFRFFIPAGKRNRVSALSFESGMLLYVPYYQENFFLP